eukprot:TRINITY_DN1013_c0_g1_i2.p1 TRINITY_DN1013_c0_g1~~TRINITY_DN1013_c0_g1_i2.p1  ORF type:complete len:654 (+),score=179.63 TRINITY_DN1013_c0_g1_i2:99-1964(+)
MQARSSAPPPGRRAAGRPAGPSPRAQAGPRAPKVRKPAACPEPTATGPHLHLDAQLAQMRQQLARERSDKAALQQALDQAHNEQQELWELRRIRIQQADENKQKLDRCKERAAKEMEEALERCKRKAAEEKEVELEKVNLELMVSQQEAADLRKKNEELGRQNATLREESNAKQKSQELAVQDRERRLEEAEGTIEELRKELQERDVCRVAASLNHLMAENAELKDTAEELEKKLSILERERKAAAADLRSEKAERADEVRSLSKRCETLGREKVKVQEQLRQMQQQLGGAQEQLQKVQEQSRQQLQERLQEAEEQVQQQARETLAFQESARSEAERVQEENMELAAELQKAREQAAEHKGSAQALAARLAEAEERAQHLTELAAKHQPRPTSEYAPPPNWTGTLWEYYEQTKRQGSRGPARQTWAVVPVAGTSDEHVALMASMETKYPQLLGGGRDRKDPKQKYNALNLQSAWRVENPALWERFALARKQIYAAVQSGALPKTEKPLKLENQHSCIGPQGKALPELHSGDGVNEVRLFHCTSDREALQSIVREGLNERFSKRRLAGCASYFSEDPGKADQYASVFDSPGGAAGKGPGPPDFGIHRGRREPHGRRGQGPRQ